MVICACFSIIFTQSSSMLDQRVRVLFGFFFFFFSFQNILSEEFKKICIFKFSANFNIRNFKFLFHFMIFLAERFIEYHFKIE
jgi:hypothetical protein